MSKTLILSALLASCTATASAATLSSTFTSFYVFGDSNSDPGNLGSFGPPPPYFNNQFSNGPVWTDLLDDQFETGDPNDIRTSNYAFGGAKVTETSDVPDLPLQLEVFVADLDPSIPDPLPGTPVLGDRPLISLWFGANDIRAIYTDYLAARDASSALTGDAAQAAIEAAQNAARLEASQAGALFGQALAQIAAVPQIGDILTLTTADAGATPEYDEPVSIALLTELSLLFNDALNVATEQIEAAGTNVYKIDIFGLQQQVAADPDAFGLTNATDACLTFTVSGQSLCSDPDSYLYWDDIGHLSGAAHSVLAGIVEQSILAEVATQDPDLTPVPLPASLPFLAAGLAVFGGLRLRRGKPA